MVATNYTATLSEIEMFCEIIGHSGDGMKTSFAKHLIETYGGNFDAALTMYWQLMDEKPEKSPEESALASQQAGNSQDELISNHPRSGQVQEQVPTEANELETALRKKMKSDGSVPYDGRPFKNVIDVRYDAWPGPRPDFQCTIRKRNLTMEVDFCGNYIKVLNSGETVIDLNNWTIHQTWGESREVEFRIREDELKLVGTSVCLNPGQSLTIWASISAGSNSPSAFKMRNSRWSAGNRTTVLLDSSKSEVCSQSLKIGSSQEQLSGKNCTILLNYVEAVIPASGVDWATQCLIKESINRLQEMSGTRMEVVEWSNDGNGFVRIYGDQPKVDHGLQLLYDLLDQKVMTVRASYVRVDITIPGPKADFITDNGGEIIKKLQESSGTRIVVIEDGPQGENVKKLRVYGDQLKVEKAKQLVYDLLAEELETDVPCSSSRKRTRSS